MWAPGYMLATLALAFACEDGAPGETFAWAPASNSSRTQADAGVTSAGSFRGGDAGAVTSGKGESPLRSGDEAAEHESSTPTSSASADADASAETQRTVVVAEAPDPPDTVAPSISEAVECERVVPGQRGETELAGAFSVTSYGDAASTRCMYTDPGRVCLSGVTAVAAKNARNAGAGVELLLADATTAAGGLSALGASAAQVVGFSLTLELAGEAPVRISLTSIAHPNAELLLSGTPAGDITRPGWLALNFRDFALPRWYAEGPSFIDGTQLRALRVRAAAGTASARPYLFCVSDLQWIDDNGMPVASGP